jgi:hypothetical protein
LYEKGGDGPPDAVQATLNYDRACDLGHDEACIQIALSAKDPATTKNLFERMCTTGRMRGCAALGEQIFFGNGVPVETQRGADLMQKACTAKEPHACESLGDGWRRNKPPDFVKARTFYEMACEAGRPRACRLLAVLYAQGQGVDTNDIKALGLFDRACDLDEDAVQCIQIGIDYAPPTGGHGMFLGTPFGEDNKTYAKDGGRALAFFRKADATLSKRCTAGMAKVCEQLAGILEPEPFIDPANGSPKDGARARELYGKACDAGVTSSCVSLANLLRDGRGGAKDTIHALDIYRKQCEAGGGDIGYVCNQAGVLSFQSQDPSGKEVALKMVTRGCEQYVPPKQQHGDVGAACNNLSLLYANGWGVAADAAKSGEYAKRACDLGNKEACGRAPH